MGATATLALQAILAALQAAPQIEAIVAAGKTFIDGLFSGKAITSAEQEALHAAVDANAKLAALGTPPLSWTVEPDPAA